MVQYIKFGLLQFSILPVIFLLWNLSIDPIPTYANQTLLERFQDQIESNRIKEAVFRHLVAEHSPELNDNIHFVILFVDSIQVDPEARFGLNPQEGSREIDNVLFLSLNNLPVPLKRQQECSYLNREGEVAEESEWIGGGVIENKSMQRGLRYSVGETIRWVNDDYVQVYAGYWYQSLAAGGWICHVRKQEGKWIVIQLERKWVS